MSTATLKAPGLVRGLIDQVEVRKIDLEKRTCEFVAATENGVMSFGGPTYLRMKGLDLKRYKKNPVLIDNHDLSSGTAQVVIGKSLQCYVDGKELIIQAEFAKTARAEEIWQLVSGGFVRAVSVRFMPDPEKTIYLSEGQTEGRGADKVTGPATIYNRSMLIEISVVPVPKDEDTLKFGFDPEPQPEGDPTMSQQQTPAPVTPAPAPAPAATPAPAAAPVRDEVQQERSLREAKATAEHIKLITPVGLEGFAQGLISQGLTVEAARAKLLEEYAKGNKPVGTNEPKEVTQGADKTEGAAPKLAEVSDDMLIRSICG